MTELYDIPGYAPYKISKKGSVMGFKTFLNPGVDKDGHIYVTILGKKISVSRLIAITFIPNPGNYLHLKHIDGDRSNCSISNLEWRRYKNTIRLDEIQVLTIRKCRAEGLLLKQLALYFKICTATVHMICKGVTWKESN